MLDWNKLFCSDRLKKAGEQTPSEKPAPEHRLPIERDYDRILFSTPVRRLADKTQVFPLEKNDSVRTRLTHSHEVSNLCRSIGTALVYQTKIFDSHEQAARNVPAMLAAIGLAHDLGNPPFGHQGEKFIGQWFKNHFAESKLPELNNRARAEFESFEGNAQTLRVVTKLQLINDNRGLNLTLGTLAALMKYPVSADKTNKTVHANKKYNYFFSEDDIVNQIRAATGLVEGQRHPLTFIMEACDDIAYCVLDVEDTVKKCLASVSDVLAWLTDAVGKLPSSPRKELVEKVIRASADDLQKYRGMGLSPNELNDAAMQKLRVHSISAMVDAIVSQFQLRSDEMLNGTFTQELMADSTASILRDELKNFGTEHAYKHVSVREKELKGFKVITGLMTMFYDAIKAKRAKSADPFQTYVYSRISENYRRVADNPATPLPPNYADYRLLTDMISGMTDTFAVDLYDQLIAFK